MLFYPGAAPIPARLRTDSFLVRPLRAADAELDYDAYMSSPETILIHSGGRWPVEGFTVEENRVLAAQHERDHLARKSFTFIVMNPTETKSLGCVYLLALLPYLQRIKAADEIVGSVGDYEAMVTFWVRESERDSGLDKRLVAALLGWLKRDWAFSRVVFRVNNEEQRSLRALEAAGLRRLSTLTTDYRPYIYYLYGETI